MNDYTVKNVAEAWAQLKIVRPLIFHVTNAVATALQANICLAIGASPIMSQFPTEAEELIAIANGFLINLGTPTDAALETVKLGLSASHKKNCLTLLDPVGYGASRFRIESTDSLLKKHNVSIIKGNMGEISLLAGAAGAGGSTRGVDSITSENPEISVLEAARKYKCIVCATGENDYLSDGKNVIRVSGGSALLPFLSGSGCALGTIILSVAAACGDIALGTLTGALAIGLASEHAENNNKCGGVGTFPASLIDELYRLTPNDFEDINIKSRWNVV